MNWQPLKDFVIQQKILFTYSYGWMGGIGWGWLVTDSLHKYPFFSDIPIIALFVAGVIGIWFVGWCLFTIGLFAKEQSFSTNNNPALKEMIEGSKQKKKKKKK